jgi:uncharacterized metal-binding protein YceD (DUF177 family)
MGKSIGVEIAFNERGEGNGLDLRIENWHRPVPVVRTMAGIEHNFKKSPPLEFTLSQLCPRHMLKSRQGIWKISEDISSSVLNHQRICTDDIEGCCSSWLNLTIIRQKERFQLKGDVSAVLELVCHRCALPFVKNLEVPLDGWAVCAQAVAAGEEKEDADVLYTPEDLNLSEWLHNELILALPIQLLCQDNCQGLCGQCGCNLNHEQCACPPL